MVIIIEHLPIYLIPGRFAFLKTYEANQTYIANGAGFIRVLQTNQDNHMTISEFENIEMALVHLKYDLKQKIGIYLNEKQIQIFTYDNKQDAIRSMFQGGHSFERLQRSQLDFFYSLQKTIDFKRSHPTLVFRIRNEKRRTIYDERLRIYGIVLLFLPSHYDLHHFLTRLDMDYVDGRFTKILNHD